jgi:crotonobetainyl-CoA:carnitine CoA-transferase CaiB-like acyl-CoA transferase
LSGVPVGVSGTGADAWHAARMLGWLGAVVGSEAENSGAAADWAASGVMALTGRRDGPPLLPPGQAASAVNGALLATECLARMAGGAPVLPRAGILSERAAIAGLQRDAPRSAGGAFRILRAADGWLGVNLARESDRELLPAWLEDHEPALEKAVAARTIGELTDRARLLGLPAAALPTGPDEQLAARGQLSQVLPFVLTRFQAPRVTRGAAHDGRHLAQRRLGRFMVVDLSSLWAGPLCGHLLTALGARVIKVESVHRPDGARLGGGGFYDLLHAGQESVALDFTTPAGRSALAGLVAAADVVIEASRPRALRQVGIHAEDLLARGQDKCWISITAYGRTGPWANAVGFGDDAAMAAGLVAFDPATGTPAPCGDAIADPVTGVNAALVALACRLAGGTWLADLAMREQVAATMIRTAEPCYAGPASVAVLPPPREPAGQAPELGADTAAVLAELLPR